ncbi:MAG: hypothetical protein V1898_01915 [Patescibacteria group bacterium]
MMNKIKIQIILLATIFISSFFISSSALALGISPPIINVQQLNSGNLYQSVIYLFRSPSERNDLDIKVNIRGKGSEYIQSADEILMKAGVDQIEYNFAIQAEPSTNGDFQVQIDFVPQAHEADQEVSILAGATLQINFSVQNEGDLAYDISHISLDKNITGQNVMSCVLENTGTLDWQPEKIVMLITQSEIDWDYQMIFTQDDISTIKPGKQTSLEAIIPEVLFAGNYQVKIKNFKSDKVINEYNSDTLFVSAEILEPAEAQVEATNALDSIDIDESVQNPASQIKYIYFAIICFSGVMILGLIIWLYERKRK